MNKHPQIFMTILNKLIQRAGHDLKFNMLTKPINNKDRLDVPLKDKIADIDETKYDIKKLLNNVGLYKVLNELVFEYYNCCGIFR